MQMEWTISQVDQTVKNGQFEPTTAHWQCTVTDTGDPTSIYGSASITGAIGTSVQDYLTHIWENAISKTEVEQRCVQAHTDKRIAASAMVIEESFAVSAPTAPLESAKAAALKRVDDVHTAVVQKLVGSPTQVEKDTWSLKLDAAKSVLAGTPVAEAGLAFFGASGITDRRAWAQTVVAKSAGFAYVVGVGEKLRAQARAAIQAATTAREVAQALESSVTATEQLVSQFLQRMASNG